MSELIILNIIWSSTNTAIDGPIQAESSAVNIKLYHTCVMCQSRIPYRTPLGEDSDGLRTGRTTKTRPSMESGGSK